jgi:hypothetical protein
MKAAPEQAAKPTQRSNDVNITYITGERRTGATWLAAVGACALLGGLASGVLSSEARASEAATLASQPNLPGPLPCAVKGPALDVLPATGLVSIRYGGQTEVVKLTSAGRPLSVLVRQPDTAGGVPIELLSMSLVGNSTLVGPIEIQAGRQYELPVAKSQPQRPSAEGGTFEAVFYVHTRIVFRDLYLEATGSQPVTYLIQRQANMLQVAAASIVLVEHPGRRCSAGRGGTGHCDIVDPNSTCWEVFENGVHKGCTS